MATTIPSLRSPRWPVLVAAAACLALAAFLAAHYPLGRVAALLAVAAAATLAMRYWLHTPLLIGLIPVIGFAPWSGWITFEELDMLALAVAAGGYAAWAFGRPPQERAPAWRRSLAYSPLARLLMTVFAASLLLALQRGFADAGGFVFGWFQGYLDPMNSVRLTKSYFLVLLLLPLWVRAAATRPNGLMRTLLLAMLVALLGISLAALWERVAHTGLLNFSSDYRSTALFWEMHVGGAALDGSLALTIPFAVHALLQTRSPRRFILLAALLVLAAYATITTFSRGLYVAVPLSLAVLVLLRSAQKPRGLPVDARMSMPLAGKLGGLLLMAGFALSVALMFEGSGYRGEMALLGVMLALLAMPASQWHLRPAQRFLALLMGALLALLLAGACWAVSMAVKKAAYVEFAIAFAVVALLRWKDRPGESRPLYACLLSGAWFWLLACMVIVADYWGGEAASDAALWCAIGLALLWTLMLLCRPLWPFRDEGMADWRSRGLLFAGLLLVGVVVSALGGGAYIRERASRAPEDMQVRINHWKQGYWMLRTPEERLLGKGAGRFTANHFLLGPPDEHTGDYRIKTDAEGHTYLMLTGGMHQLGWGELFRVSQRIAAPQGNVLLKARVRARTDTELHAEICEKHLLYNNNCLSGSVKVRAGDDWQNLSLPLGQAGPMGGDWYAPRFIVFSVAVEAKGTSLDIDAMQLLDTSGADLLSNGGFANEMSHWFFSSDKYHLPWHMKNFALHVMFDQGLVGLVLMGLLLLLALWRTSLGSGRHHFLAPPVAASLVGFLAVGMFDSLIDAPRLAFMFYAVLFVAMGLRAMPAAVDGQAPAAGPKG